MSTLEVSKLLRPGLLRGVSMMLAGPAGIGDDGRSLGPAVARYCRELGAGVHECLLDVDGSSGHEEHPLERAVDRLLLDAGGFELLVVDAAGLLAAATVGASGRPDAARTALAACLDASWNVTRALAARVFLPGERGGRIVYLAPALDGGEHSDAARAGLENLARTLSIEWSRHGITTVTVVPPPSTGRSSTPEASASSASSAAPEVAAAEVAALSAYLSSPAGAYFSGCLLDLGAGGAGGPAAGG
jgi:NAD(P)-dependent dehydrogenase (short-subunit alcohol dehydrogenase family)